MFHTIMLVPIGENVGLTSISLGIIQFAKKNGINLSLSKPIDINYLNEKIFDQKNKNETEKNVKKSDSSKDYLFSSYYDESIFIKNKRRILIEKVIQSLYKIENKSGPILINGLSSDNECQFDIILNYEMALSLGSKIIFVITLNSQSLKKFRKRMYLIYSCFGGHRNRNILGVIINKIGKKVSAWEDQKNSSKIIHSFSQRKVYHIDHFSLSKNSPIPILSQIPWNEQLTEIRLVDIAEFLHARILNEGKIHLKRIKSIMIYNSDLNELDYMINDSLLIILTSNFDLVCSILKKINKKKVNSILLLNEKFLNIQINQIIFSNHIFLDCTVLSTSLNISEIFQILKKISNRIPKGDYERKKMAKEHVSNYLDNNWIQVLSNSSSKFHKQISSAFFQHQILKKAEKEKKSILLPEGEEIRIIKAASICSNLNIAKCVLLGRKEKILRLSIKNGIKLGKLVQIIEPDQVREKYVERLVELRSKTSITKSIASIKLRDNIMLGTLMLERNKADGLVSGATHTTASSILPALQIIKTSPGNTLISSVFFMLLPEQVLVYGDCAVNIDPTFEQLAEIAIQSAHSASILGIEPRIAMISYSTGESGTGTSVEKVKKATQLIKKRRPDLTVDGPLQYDTAAVNSIALLKAPNSPVAGRATVFIFPNLDSGNAVYKAVQHSANIISIGPILQGIRKPLNDLSRGASVEDIVYTIAVTAIQAKHIDHV